MLIDPVKDYVTNLVVKEDSDPNTEYIVPVEFVTETIADTIRLSCSKAELEKMEPFIITNFIQEKVPDRYTSAGVGMYGGGAFYLPYSAPDITVYEKEEFQQIPPGELSVRRGTRVEASDGYVGKVDEFVVHPKTGHITHLVMREGHLWGKKDVIIPVSDLSPMGNSYEDTIYLKLTKHEIEALPTFPLHRRWS